MSFTDPVDAAVFALAAHRLTRLVTKDTITAGPRDALIARSYHRHGREFLKVAGIPYDHPTAAPWRFEVEPRGGWTLYAEQDDDSPKLAALLTCRWCASIHVSLALLVLAGVWPKGCKIVTRMLALSSVATLIARAEK